MNWLCNILHISHRLYSREYYNDGGSFVNLGTLCFRCDLDEIQTLAYHFPELREVVLNAGRHKEWRNYKWKN